MKRTYQPKKRARKREHGFLARTASKGGRPVLPGRGAKGPRRLAAYRDEVDGACLSDASAQGGFRCHRPARDGSVDRAPRPEGAANRWTRDACRALDAEIARRG